MSTSRRASTTSTWPHAPNSGPWPPKVPAPRLSAGTCRPDAPSLRYSTATPNGSIVSLTPAKVAVPRGKRNWRTVMTDTEAEPGTVRPGGRTARVRAAVLRAAGDALAEHGFAHLDLADVARRAGAGKTTVYRRWGTVPGLVADLLIEMAESSLPRTETGSLLGDLRANARLVRRTLTDPRQGRLFQAILAAATCDERTAEALHRFYEVRVNEWAPCVTRAAERGEV